MFQIHVSKNMVVLAIVFGTVIIVPPLSYFVIVFDSIVLSSNIPKHFLKIFDKVTV